MHDRARRLPILAVLTAILAGCSNLPQNLEEEVVSSIAYDKTPCPELVTRRNALVAQYGDPAKLPADEQPGSRPDYLPVGSATILPDTRSSAERDRRLALGEIAAMDRSIKRRACGS